MTVEEGQEYRGGSDGAKVLATYREFGKSWVTFKVHYFGDPGNLYNIVVTSKVKDFLTNWTLVEPRFEVGSTYQFKGVDSHESPEYVILDVIEVTNPATESDAEYAVALVKGKRGNYITTLNKSLINRMRLTH